jgi:hypothetical protein
MKADNVAAALNPADQYNRIALFTPSATLMIACY